MDRLNKRIASYNAGRLASVMPIKYQALKEGVFRFFRGTDHLFYEDLAGEKELTAGPLTWICGDLHLENFGTYKGDNRLVYFDVNDFDECTLAPVSLEVLRVLTSIHLACRELQVDAANADELVGRFLNTYLNVLGAGKPHSFQRETAHGVVKDLIKAVEDRKDRELLEKRTEQHKGIMRLSIIEGKTALADAESEARMQEAFQQWNSLRHFDYKIMDMACRIMGTGSLGLERYIVLCYDTAADKTVLLDLKEACPSSISLFHHFKQPSWDNHAQRIVKVQTLMQDTPPALLDYLTAGHKSYVIKELQPSQDKLDLHLVSRKSRRFENTIDAMADITASAHLRATGRYTSDTADALIDHVRSIDKVSWLRYAADYAKQVEADFQEFSR